MVADPSRVFGPSGSGGGGTRGPRCPRPQTPTLSFPLPCAGDVRGVNPTKGVTTRVRAKPRSASHLVHHPTCPGHRSILASNEGRDDSGRSNLSGSPFGGGTSKRWATRSRHQQVRVTRQVQSQTEAAAARRPRRRGERKQSVQRRQEAASESAARSGVRNCSRSPLEMPRTGWNGDSSRRNQLVETWPLGGAAAHPDFTPQPISPLVPFPTGGGRILKTPKPRRLVRSSRAARRGFYSRPISLSPQRRILIPKPTTGGGGGAGSTTITSWYGAGA